MRSLLALFILLTVMLFTACSTDSGFVATAGEERMKDEHGWALLAPADYLELAGQIKIETNSDFEVLDPGSIENLVGVGILGLGVGAFGSFALLQDEEGSYLLVVDFDADGRIDPEPPVPFRKTEDRWTAASTIRAPVLDYLSGKLLPSRLTLDLLPGEDGEHPRYLLEQTMTRRDGSIRLGERTVPFAIDTPRGMYAFSEVCFDLDADGVMPARECFNHKERRVVLFDLTYDIAVGPMADSLTLTPVDDPGTPLARGIAGEPAPDFEFEDSTGARGRLSDYRGRVVLLDFWATWCFPCVADLPKLIDLHARYAGEGLIVLGIDVDDEDADLERFLRDRPIPWRQIPQDFASPIVRSFGIDGLPSYVLIDREGRILSWPTVYTVVESVEAAMGPPES